MCSPRPVTSAYHDLFASLPMTVYEFKCKLSIIHGGKHAFVKTFATSTRQPERSYIVQLFPNCGDFL